MKIETSPMPPAFEPRSLTLTFVSQNEMDAFGNLLNHVCTMDAATKVYLDKGLNVADMTEKIRHNLKKIGGNPSANWYEFNQHVKAYFIERHK